uniref:uncharacterized protein LOC101294312 isoform X2 n=1 Tax=Fragaria vesca subsp. vesca TaxID=101020 RepID=UPI0005CA7D6A|nr:PREDICTED: uncharacterized protein LOC101294312 isoform X2 [Fragaria vesca subsp. vesca]
MPRTVSPCEVQPEIFEDRPAKLGRKIEICHVETKDPHFEVASKPKLLHKDNALVVGIVLNQQFEYEEKLAERQEGALKGIRGYEMMNGVITDMELLCVRHTIITFELQTASQALDGGSIVYQVWVTLKPRAVTTPMEARIVQGILK